MRVSAKTKTPKPVKAGPRLTPAQRMLWRDLEAKFGRFAETSVSTTQIQQLQGMSLSTAQRSILALERVGLLERVILGTKGSGCESVCLIRFPQQEKRRQRPSRVAKNRQNAALLSPSGSSSSSKTQSPTGSTPQSPRAVRTRKPSAPVVVVPGPQAEEVSKTEKALSEQVPDFDARKAHRVLESLPVEDQRLLTRTVAELVKGFGRTETPAAVLTWRLKMRLPQTLAEARKLDRKTAVGKELEAVKKALASLEAIRIRKFADECDRGAELAQAFYRLTASALPLLPADFSRRATEAAGQGILAQRAFRLELETASRSLGC